MEVLNLTVINKLNQTLEMLNMCKSNFKTFSMDTDDQNAKQMYKQLSQNLDTDINMLKSRINFVMSEEPQYQEGQNMQNQNNQMNQQDNNQTQ